MNIIFTLLLIFFLRLIDVILMTTVTLSMVSNNKFRAAIIGFIETILYVVILGRVMKQLDNVWALLAYGCAYGTGIYLAMLLEERFSESNFTAQIVIARERSYMIEEIRQMNIPVTVLDGKGIEEQPRLLLYIVVNKNKFPALEAYAKEHGLFMTVNKSMPLNGYFR